MKADKILAGIIVYNPDIGRLGENYKSLATQVDEVVFIDNSSSNLSEVEREFGDKVCIVKNKKNLGVAAALNQMFEYAIEHSYDAVITMDQDSVMMPGLVEQYKKQAKLKRAGLLCCKIIDRNFGHDSLDDKQTKFVEAQKLAITSGSFCSVEAYKKTDGFDEQMFIDSVDFDYCIQLRKKGYRIYRLNFEGLLHEVGHGKKVRILWRDFVAFNHSAFRNYYMARNDIYLTRKHTNKYNPIWRVVTRELISEYLIIGYEENKLEKLKSRWLGIKDAFKMPVK